MLNMAQSYKTSINKNIFWTLQYKYQHYLPISSKILIYFANVQSHINYALSPWGPMISRCDLKKLQIQQNKAIRAIFNISNRTRLRPYFVKAKILNIEELIELSLLKISFRYTSDILPRRIVNLFELPDHTYFTRNRNNLLTRSHTSSIYSKSFLARSPHLWLHLPIHIKNKENIKLFAKAYCIHKQL